jgi:hypothetical protein
VAEDGHFALSPSEEIRERAREFSDACSEHTQRLALVALVLRGMAHGPT